MTIEVRPARVDRETLRGQISELYAEVAITPERGAHFHTGKPLAIMVGYPESVIDSLPTEVVDSFAGTGNPFSMGDMRPGETVLDVGCGAGFDSLIAALQVGPSGRVIGINSWYTFPPTAPGAAVSVVMGPPSLQVRNRYATVGRTLCSENYTPLRIR